MRKIASARIIVVAMATTAAGTLLSTDASAQKMYRCGNNYQDRPCAAGQKGKVIGSTGADSSTTPATSADADCSQRGKDSLKIAWSREGGATEEQLVDEIDRKRITDSDKEAQKALVHDVYKRRGNAARIQTSVEADCAVEKEKAARAAELLDAVTKAQATLKKGSTAPAKPEVDQERLRADAAAREAQTKKATCDRLNASMDSIRASERAGGNARTMDSLNEQRRSIRAQAERAGCGSL